ncbi:hypothetical protein OT109_13540 [Phycisphaeraceae bacterium D3-23]
MPLEQLDLNLIEAYDRVRAELGKDPARLGRRVERTLRASLRRPMRAWCVGVRAGDARFTWGDMADENDGLIACKGYGHTVMLRSRRLAELCAPVALRYPGKPIAEAALMLGRPERALYHWVERGVLSSRTEHTPGRRGKPTRWVWSAYALDPTADDGRPPWSVWGTLWQSLGKRLPEDASWALRRVPRMRKGVRHGGDVSSAWPGLFVGWDWECPGRVLADGRLHECGRVCKKLWLPLPVWTVGKYLAGRGDADEEVWKHDPVWDAGRCRPACAKCLGMRYDNPRSGRDEAWNRFVTGISGGLLYGREVARPAGVMGSREGGGDVAGAACGGSGDGGRAIA